MVDAKNGFDQKYLKLYKWYKNKIVNFLVIN